MRIYGWFKGSGRFTRLYSRQVHNCAHSTLNPLSYFGSSRIPVKTSSNMNGSISFKKQVHIMVTDNHWWWVPVGWWPIYKDKTFDHKKLHVQISYPLRKRNLPFKKKKTNDDDGPKFFYLKIQYNPHCQSDIAMCKTDHIPFYI